jgi:predicted transcriptional regulator
MGEKKTRRLSFALTDDEYARLKGRADELRLPMSWLVWQAVMAYIDEQPRKRAASK